MNDTNWYWVRKTFEPRITRIFTDLLIMPYQLIFIDINLCRSWRLILLWVIFTCNARNETGHSATTRTPPNVIESAWTDAPSFSNRRKRWPVSP